MASSFLDFFIFSTLQGLGTCFTAPLLGALPEAWVNATKKRRAGDLKWQLILDFADYLTVMVS
jgi:hypothetical protein